MNYKKINLIGGWFTFTIATIVYFLTIEQTVSLWDCGEYITAAYKLEVGHPPGAPLFMLLGRLFSFFVAPENVALMINAMSALSSSFTILFMYWSITMMAKKIAFSDNKKSSTNENGLTKAQIIAIQGSALVGGLAYTFSESFWFSAVEGEVYAMSSLFTAVIFWAILKWDEETSAAKLGELSHTKNASRWLVLIMFLFGLAIGVHLLGLLVIPAIAYVIYFNKWENFKWSSFFITGIIGVVALGFIQEGLIPGTISWASKTEIFFRNELGLPFNTGAIFFFAATITLLIVGLFFTQKMKLPILNTAILGLVVLMIGYGSFATIVIRSNANTPLDENDPENLVTLHAYLKREQYGSWPILHGEYWNSAPAETGHKSPVYQRKFVVTKGDKELKGFKSEELAKEYAAKENGQIVEKYFMVNDGQNQKYIYTGEHTTIFPRMFWSQDKHKVDGYKSWSGYNANGPNHTAKPKIPTTDGQRLPTFGENMRYFVSYQLNWMYFRYFMWNFAGRQNDIQGHGDIMRGNWKSGINFVDSERLGDQTKAPLFTQNNPSNNSFYFLPLILGLLGLAFHFYKAPKDAFVVFLLFIFTGLAIVIYLNQKPFEPRERDYAYAASFYAFAMWIGLGVYALFDAYKSLSKNNLKQLALGTGAVLFIFLVRDISAGEYSGSLGWLVVGGIGIGATALMFFLRDKIKNDAQASYIALAMALIAPVIMGVEGWDDHNRSGRSTALDLAKNYLYSCEDNSIIFTNGDNDTFPLWYLQEVEGEKTSVRVCNLSLLQTDWYTEQMTMKMYDSEPLPITLREDQYAMHTGKTDAVYFLNSYMDMVSSYSKEVVSSIYSLKVKSNQATFNSAYRNAALTLANYLTKTDIASRNQDIINFLTEIKDEPDFNDFNQFMKISIAVLQSGISDKSGLTRELLEQIQQNMTNLENAIDYLPIADAMNFVRDDNMLMERETRSGSFDKLRIFPSSGFIIPTGDVQDLIDNKIIREDQRTTVSDEIKFKINGQAITKEQVVMMDILSNFDWKRNIYFSSPYASEVGKAIFQAGFVTMEGMVYRLTPVKGEQVNLPKLHENLMDVYLWSNMDNPSVLVDYYTRRHTSQYRHYFFILAEQYAREFDNLTKTLETLERTTSEITSDQEGFVNQINEVKQKRDKAKENAIAVVLHSLRVMPIKNVIDYGEPTSSKQSLPPGSGLDYIYNYQDGKIHEYARILYSVGAHKEAEEVAHEIADELESIMNFTLTQYPRFASDSETDFFSAFNSYLELFSAASDVTEDTFTVRANAFTQDVRGRIRELITKMKEEDAGKDRGNKTYSGLINSFEDRLLRLGLVNGIEL
jgi:MFS family permease